ncbi:MAG: ASCH domain-containing protein [Bacteroidales bacterium]|nr:ASCH domain-containing protein [Bacteroidales bacterium]
MEILDLIIKQQWFDAILSGEKTKETREIRPTTSGRYVEYYDTRTGEAFPQGHEFHEDDENVGVKPKHYDAIRFYVGYQKDRASALVRVLDAEIFTMKYDDGEPAIYEYKGKKYVAAQIDYTLGDIIESNV